MWSFPPQRRNSRSPPHSPRSPAQGPYFASALAESPEVSAYHFSPHTAHTPIHHLDPVDEIPGLTGRTAMTGSGGSRAPLLSRDFASRPMVDRMDDHERDREQAGDNDGSVREITSVKSDAPTLHPPPKGKTLPVNPLLVPPPSVHDAYVSKIIQPMAPPDLPPTQPPSPAAVDRPPIFRTASAPAPNPNNPRKLLPSPLPSKPVKKVEDGTPIFEIFDADLSEPASEMVKALKGHLEGVLRVQEEIGRMHLTLEKLTVVGQGSWEDFEPSSPQAGTRGTTKEAPRRKSQAETPGSVESEGSRRGSKGTAEMGQAGGDTPGSKAKKVEAEQALLKREQEVDEIMSKLGTMSERLRTYHTLGTPRLSFPQPHAASPMSPTLQPLPVASGSRTTPKRPVHDNDREISPPHIAVANLRGQHMPLSPMQQIRQRSNSNLGASAFSRSLTTLEEPSAENVDHPVHPNHPYRMNKGGNLFANSSVSLLRDRVQEEEIHPRDTGPDPLFSPTSPMEERDASRGRMASWAFGDDVRAKERDKGEESWMEHTKLKSPEPSRAPLRNAGRRWVDSPVELLDRSRPW